MNRIADADGINSEIHQYSLNTTSGKKIKVDSKETEFSVHLSGRFFSSCETQSKSQCYHIASEKSGPTNTEKCNDLKAKLFANARTHLNSYDTLASHGFDESMIYVKIENNNTIHGSIVCIACRNQDKYKKISVYCHVVDHRSFYWIIGNLTKHLKSFHKLKPM